MSCPNCTCSDCEASRPIQLRILRVLTKTPMSKDQISDLVGNPDRGHLSNHLSFLTTGGQISRVGHGMYAKKGAR